MRTAVHPLVALAVLEGKGVVAGGRVNCCGGVGEQARHLGIGDVAAAQGKVHQRQGHRSLQKGACGPGILEGVRLVLA